MTGLKRIGLKLEEQIGKLLLPGDEFHLGNGENVTIGPGLKYLPAKAGLRNETVLVAKGGILAKRKPNVYFMDVRLRTYSTYKKDDVVGIIKQKKGDQYVVDIGTRDRVTLSKMAFEGATKKYRPDLKIGDCVFGKFLDLPPDYPLEITCVNSQGKAVGQGNLSEGFIAKVPVHMVNTLRSSATKGTFMAKVGAIVPLELVVGSNGYVWIKSKKVLTTILLSQLFQAASVQPPENYNQLIRSFRESVTGWV